jgi:hypothetical protein
VPARLREPGAVFKLDPAARCRRVSAEVAAPVLEPRLGASAAATGAPGHAELDAQITYDCARPGEVRALEVGRADSFERIGRVDVQGAGPRGQAQTTLRGTARSVKLGR